MSVHTQPFLNAQAMSNPLVAYDLEIARLSWKCYSRIMLWAWNKSRKPTPEEEQAVRLSKSSYTSVLLIVSSSLLRISLHLLR
jgi:hypothetical protein